ncbi:PfkB family carbohydrate kinase [Paenibacillus dauci]|uniref:PfkB family carbohydrate kinase n=1 Tax=Paenibacillus dauci TaxID=1567106 RepID=UPI0009E610CB
MRQIIIPASVFSEVVAGQQTQIEAVFRTAKLGAEGIEIRRELFTHTDPIAEQLQQCRQAIQSAGLQTTVYSVPMQLWRADHQLDIDVLSLVLSEADQLGADQVKLSLGHYEAELSPLDQLGSFMKAYYLPLNTSEQQKGHTVKLLIENDQTTYGGDPKRLLAFFREIEKWQLIDHIPPVRMTWDTGNWLYAGYEEAALQTVADLSPYVSYIHAKHSIVQGNEYTTLPLPEEQEAVWRQLIRQLPRTANRAIEFTLTDDSAISYYCSLLADQQGGTSMPRSRQPIHVQSEHKADYPYLDVVTFGEAMTMFVAEQSAPLHEVSLFSRRLAGAEANAAIGFARLGLRSGWASRVGSDVFGSFVREKLAEEGVNLAHVLTDARYPTGFQLKSKVTSGDPEVQYFRRGSAASRMNRDEMDREYFTSARHLHMTGIPLALSASNREFARAVIMEMKQAGRTISFDPNLRPQLWESQQQMVSVINEFAAYADVVLPGIEEGAILTGSRDPQQIARFYLDLGVKLVVVKLGPSGAAYYTQDQSGSVPGFIVSEVIDTVGAGDGFAVGIVSGWLAGLPIEELVSRGCAIGALAVQSVGDHEGYPAEAQLQHYMEQGKRTEVPAVLSVMSPSLKGVN